LSDITIDREIKSKKKIPIYDRRNGFKYKDNGDKNYNYVEEMESFNKTGQRIVGSSFSRSIIVNKPEIKGFNKL